LSFENIFPSKSKSINSLDSAKSSDTKISTACSTKISRPAHLHPTTYTNCIGSIGSILGAKRVQELLQTFEFTVSHLIKPFSVVGSSRVPSYLPP
jgi:hypothetical protein